MKTISCTLSLAERLEVAYQLNPVHGLSLLLENYSDQEVEIAKFEANPQRKGIGSSGMRFLVSLADKMGINLMLIPIGRPGSLEHNRLEVFYGRFGFLTGPCNDIMRRESNKRRNEHGN